MPFREVNLLASKTKIIILDISGAWGILEERGLRTEEKISKTLILAFDVIMQPEPLVPTFDVITSFLPHF